MNEAPLPDRELPKQRMLPLAALSTGMAVQAGVLRLWQWPSGIFRGGDTKIWRDRISGEQPQGLHYSYCDVRGKGQDIPAPANAPSLIV